MKIPTAIIGVLASIVTMFAVAADKTKVLGNIHGAKAKECFRVVDQEGNPVVGARFYGGFMLDGHKDCVLIDGVTDTNGVFIAEGRCKDRLGYQTDGRGLMMTIIPSGRIQT